ncbi:MAG: Inositol-1-monophosphatase, partial [uncultured bacterium]
MQSGKLDYVETTEELKKFAIEVASGAGQLLKEAFQTTAAYQHERCSPKAMHLAEDKTIDQWIVERIRTRYPQHEILTEESGAHAAVDNTSASETRVQWIIDPIDGSANFASRNPFVAVSVAVVVAKELTVGVIAAPLLDELFVAEKGKGATANGRPIHVSETSQLHDAYLVSCDGGAEDRRQVFSVLVRNYYDQVKDFRKLGSAALECAWV